MGYLDQMLGGVTALSLSSTAVALTQNQARNCTIRCTGTITANIVISPDAGVLMVGFYFIENLTTGSFTVTFTNAGGSYIIPQSTRVTLFIDTSNGPRRVSGGDVPGGSITTWLQAAAPTGWTKLTTSGYSDATMRLTIGSGGATGGSVLFSTLFGRTATDAHTLTIGEMPSHTHSTTAGGARTVQTDEADATVALFTSTTTGSAGGDGSHIHPLDMRVKFVDFIVCQKDA